MITQIQRLDKDEDLLISSCPSNFQARAVPVGFVRSAIVASLVFIPSLTEEVERGASTVKAKIDAMHHCAKSGLSGRKSSIARFPQNYQIFVQNCSSVVYNQKLNPKSR